MSRVNQLANLAHSVKNQCGFIVVCGVTFCLILPRPSSSSPRERPVGLRPSCSECNERPVGLCPSCSECNERPIGLRPSCSECNERPVGLCPSCSECNERPIGLRPSCSECNERPVGLCPFYSECNERPISSAFPALCSLFASFPRATRASCRPVRTGATARVQEFGAVLLPHCSRPPLHCFSQCRY